MNWAANIGRQGLRALAVAFVFTAAHAAILQSVPADADAYVRSTAEKKSFGFEHQIELRMGSGGATEGYLQFSLPQSAPYSDKVVLRVFAQLAEPGAMKALVRSVASNKWSELDLNWLTRPEHLETIGALSVVGLSGAWYEVDVTSFVKPAAVAGETQVTLALIPGEESKNRLVIHSRENPLKKPELVFSRAPLAAKISFIPPKASPPPGYLPDRGEPFGFHTNGQFYGWNMDNRAYMRDRNEAQYKRDKNPPIKAPDRRYDFVAYMDNEKMKSPVTWEMGLPNGSYKVRVVAGDSFRYDSIFGLSVEGVKVIDGVPDANRRWLEGTVTVNVHDGRLSIGHLPGSSNNKLCFIEVTEVENLLAQKP